MNELRSGEHDWLLAWARTDSAAPAMFHPLLDEFSNLEELEAAHDIPPNTPILVSPEGECDVLLCKFFLSPHFARLRNSTKESYAKDLRLWMAVVRGC